MEFDPNLLLNFVPVIAATVFTFITCLTVCCRLRNRWPVKVNCWFCNCNTKVPRQLQDWWLCPHCNQYNGFSKDGDYKYDIPEQHRSANKSKTLGEYYCQKKNFNGSKNKLCNKCNKREELKLMKLRELEDSMDQYDDKQISRFEKSFEKKYPLCLKCQSIVQNVLYRQKLWLTEYKMLLFKQKPISRMIKNRERIERILRIILSVLASVTIYCTEVWYLPLCGIALQLAACLAGSAKKSQSDAFPILGWICLICVRAFSISTVLKLLKVNFNSHWAAVDDNTYQYFIITLASAIGLTNLRFQYHKTIANGSLTLKKLETVNKNTVPPQLFSPEPTVPQHEDSFDKKESKRNLYSPVNITDSLMTSASVEMPIPVKPVQSAASFEHSFNLNKTSPFDYNSSRSFSSYAKENSFSKNFEKEGYSLNDSLNSLNSLSIGANNQKVSPSNSGIFETQIYGTSSPDLFNRNSRYQRRSILAPARLRSPQSVTQASWVAGGYWQSTTNMGMVDIPTLSRSSSQSSGIGSCAGSMYGGPSREPSIHELDQCSVHSAAEQQHQQCCFTRPIESPALSIASRASSSACKRKSNCSSVRCSPTALMTNSDISDSSLKQQQCHALHEMQCNGHTTTIVMNPVWMPALLCGSLILNMVVICTTLLR